MLYNLFRQRLTNSLTDSGRLDSKPSNWGGGWLMMDVPSNSTRNTRYIRRKQQTLTIATNTPKKGIVFLYIATNNRDRFIEIYCYHTDSSCAVYILHCCLHHVGAILWSCFFFFYGHASVRGLLRPLPPSRSFIPSSWSLPHNQYRGGQYTTTEQQTQTHTCTRNLRSNAQTFTTKC